MNLGTQTASLINHLQSRATKGQPEPTVGMGATILGWTDRHACTVTAWDEAKRHITVQRDLACRTDKNGLSESQTYDYRPNPVGSISTFLREKSGKWVEIRYNKETKRWRKNHGPGLMIGRRSEYFDPTF